MLKIHSIAYRRYTMDKVKSIKILRNCIEKIRNSSDSEKEEMIRVYEKYDKSDYEENNSDIEIVLCGKLGRYLDSSSQVKNVKSIDEVGFKSVYCSINIGDFNLEINKVKKYKVNEEGKSSTSSYERTYGGDLWNSTLAS